MGGSKGTKERTMGQRNESTMGGSKRIKRNERKYNGRIKRNKRTMRGSKGTKETMGGQNRTKRTMG